MHGKVTCINSNYVVTKYFGKRDSKDFNRHDITFIRHGKYYSRTAYKNGVIQFPIRRVDEWETRYEVMDSLISEVMYLEGLEKKVGLEPQYNYFKLKEIHKHLKAFSHWNEKYIENQKAAQSITKSGSLSQQFQNFIKNKSRKGSI